MAGRARFRMRGNGGTYVPPVDPLTFNPLTLSVLSFASDAAEGTVLATINGRTPGSTLTIVGTSAYTISGTNLLRGTGSYPVGNQVTIRESKSGYTTLDNVFDVTIVVPEAPPGAYDREVLVRYDGWAFVDLSSEVSGIHDSNLITVSISGSGGQLVLHVHNCRAMVSGESASFVHRELLDHLAVQLVGCARGSVAGVITYTGKSGAGETGSTITGTIGVKALTNFPSTWVMGADTYAMEGGMSLGDHVADPENWSIQSQGVALGAAGYAAIRSDTTGGRNIHRLVLNGTAGQSPPVIPTAGVTTNAVVLVHTSTITKTVTLSFLADTADVAPWPATDVWTSGGSNQVSRWLARTKKYPFWCRMEAGTYNPSNTYGYFNLINGVNNVALPSTNRPTAPFTGDIWDYVYTSAAQLGPGHHPNAMKISSREPWGANWGTFIINVAFLDRTASANIGLRISNIKFAVGTSVHQVYDQSAPYIKLYDLITTDHIKTFGNVSVNYGTPNNGSHKGVNEFDNYYEGPVNFACVDSKRHGSRFQTAQTTQDTINTTISNAVLGRYRSEVCWNLHIHKQGQFNPLHEDINAFRFTSGVYPTTGSPTQLGWFEPLGLTIAEFDIFGNLNAWGNGYAVTAADFATPIADLKAQLRYGDPTRYEPVPPIGTQLIGGSSYFLHDILANRFHKVRFGGLLMQDQGDHGITVDNPTTGTSVQYCSFLAPAHVTAPQGTSPYARLQNRTEVGASAVIASKNICARPAPSGSTGAFSLGGMDKLPGGAPDTSTPDPAWDHSGRGNVYNVDAADQVVRFVAPLAGASWKDIGDIVRDMAFKPGQELDAGFLPADPTIIDYRRRRVDKARLFAT